MTPTVTIPAAPPEPISDDLVMELLNPTEPAHMRMVASFHLSMALRHAITLVAQSENTEANWLADMHASLEALVEVLK